MISRFLDTFWLFPHNALSSRFLLAINFTQPRWNEKKTERNWEDFSYDSIVARLISVVFFNSITFLVQGDVSWHFLPEINYEGLVSMWNDAGNFKWEILLWRRYVKHCETFCYGYLSCLTKTVFVFINIQNCLIMCKDNDRFLCLKLTTLTMSIFRNR